MKNIIILILTFVCAAANADGKLSYGLKFDRGFWRLDVFEKDTVREGEINYSGSRVYLTSFVQDNRLYIPFAQFANDSMEIKVFSDKHVRYRGFLYQDMITTIDVYRDLKKGTMRMLGTVGTYTQFEYTTHINKKGKRSALLNWSDSCKYCTDGLVLEIDFTSEKEEGSCSGVIRSPEDVVAKFTCHSEGKLKDAFYYNDTDIIAFIVHLLIAP